MNGTAIASSRSNACQPAHRSACSGACQHEPVDGKRFCQYWLFNSVAHAEFRRPRGLRFGSDGTLYCVARDEIVAFDFASGRCLGASSVLQHFNPFLHELALQQQRVVVSSLSRIAALWICRYSFAMPQRIVTPRPRAARSASPRQSWQSVQSPFPRSTWLRSLAALSQEV